MRRGFTSEKSQKMKTVFFVLFFVIGTLCAPEETTPLPLSTSTSLPTSTSVPELTTKPIVTSEEVLEINSMVKQHVLNQANIPITFHMQNPVTPFIGRSGELSEIKWTHVDHKMAVITGQRGVGKSELARKYAQEFKHDNTSSTIWMDSETHESLIASFKDLAVTVGIKVEGKQVTTLIREVVAHFNNRKTLVVFDNAEDDNVLVKNMPSFIGNSKYIFVIITSRQSDWNHKRFKVIPLAVFTAEESKEYLKLMLKKGINVTAIDGDCGKLAETLRHLPLALSEAVAYIIQQNSLNPKRPYNINDYLIEFEGKIIPVEQPTTETVISDTDIEQVLARKLAREAKRLAIQVKDGADGWAETLANETKWLFRRFRSKLGFKVNMNKD